MNRGRISLCPSPPASEPARLKHCGSRYSQRQPAAKPVVRLLGTQQTPGVWEVPLGMQPRGLRITAMQIIRAGTAMGSRGEESDFV